MESLLTVAALILSILAFIKVHKLESTINGLRGMKSQQSAVVTTVADPAANNVYVPDTAAQGKSSIDKLWEWYAHEWQLKTGALFILLGFIWLVSYAFMNNWIGPTGRITLGIFAGIGILLFGERRLRVVQSQGITLVGLGAAITVITIYAGQTLYQTLHPLAALSMIIFTMILTTTVSLRRNILSLAVFSLVIGGLAPILTGSTEKDILGLYSYLLVMTLGVIWIARYSKWRILTFLSLIILTLYSVEYFVRGYSNVASMITPTELFQLRFFAITFISIFYFSNILTLITTVKPERIDLLTAGAIGFFTLGWVYGLAPEEYRGIICLVAALFFATGSYLVFIKTQLKSAVFIYTAIATVLLAVATAFEFEGPALVMAFSIQALLLPIVGVSLLGVDIGKYLLLYFIVPALLSFEALDRYNWRMDTLFHDSFYTLSIVMLSFLLSGMYFYERNKQKDQKLHKGAITLVIIGAVYGLIWIWRVAHVLFTPDYIARMITLFVYSMIGFGAYITGEIHKRTVLNKFGLAVLVLVVGRLLIFEVWTMELTYRIITFFLIGILFIGSVLLRKAKKQAV